MTTPLLPALAETTTLNKEQIAFLLCLLKEHREYYRLLSGSSQFTAGSLGRRTFIEELWDRLVRMQDTM
jgi:hypothetical protein